MFNVGDSKNAFPSKLTLIVRWAPLLVPPLLWAGNFVVGRAVRNDVPPMTLAFVRHLVALICLLPVCMGPLRRDLARYWQYRWHVVRTALTGLAGFNLFIYAGLQSTVASNALLLNSTIPVLIVLLGAIFYGHRLSLMQGAGMAVSCLGVVLIILHGDMKSLLSLHFSHGDLLVFLGMVSFAFYSLWLRSIPADMNRVGLLGAQLVVCVAALLPFYGWEMLSGQVATWNVSTMYAVLYIAIFASLGATFLYMAGVSRIGTARAGLFIHLIPIYGAMLSTLFLGEEIHLYHAGGLAAILAGLAIYNWEQIRASSSKPTTGTDAMSRSQQ